MNEDQIKQHIRSLEETSHNEGSADLACRCADSLIIITQLQKCITELEAEHDAAIRKGLELAISVVPGGSICDPQQVADAIRALQPEASVQGDERKDAPMTDAQIEQGWRKTFSTDNPFCPCDLKSFTKAVRWAERALAEKGERHG